MSTNVPIRQQIAQFVEQNAPTDLSEIMETFDLKQAEAQNILEQLVEAGEIHEEDGTYS